MDSVLNILEAEKKKLEAELKNSNLMHVNMRKARLNMSFISEIKQVVRLMNAKLKGRNHELPESLK